jgi:hypothetical protein
LTFCLYLAGPCSYHRALLHIFLLDGISEHSGYAVPNPVNLRAVSLVVLEVVQQLDNIGPAHITRGPIPQCWQNMVMKAYLYLPPAALVGLAMTLNIFCGQLSDGTG